MFYRHMMKNLLKRRQIISVLLRFNVYRPEIFFVMPSFSRVLRSNLKENTENWIKTRNVLVLAVFTSNKDFHSFIQTFSKCWLRERINLERKTWNGSLKRTRCIEKHFWIPSRWIFCIGYTFCYTISSCIEKSLR